MDYNIDMNKKNHGFTLIELMVTLAVFGVLAAIAAPAFNSFTDSSRRAGEVNVFSGALSYARSEAIKRNTNVIICPRTSGAETCSGANNWRTGWLVFVDTDNDGALDAGELLQIFKELGAGSNITEVSGTPLTSLTYRGSGFLTVASAEFKYCGGGNKAINARALIISRTGRARLSVDSDSDKYHEDSSGTNLSCP